MQTLSFIIKSIKGEKYIYRTVRMIINNETKPRIPMEKENDQNMRFREGRNEYKAADK